MFDHVINYASEAAALTDPVIAAYYDAAAGTWRGDVVIPGVRAFRITGYETITDPDSGESHQQEIRQDYPGWFAMIGHPQIDQAIIDLPVGNCLLVLDRTLAKARDPGFVVFASSTLSIDDLRVLHVEPTFSGSDYDFSQVPIVELLPRTPRGARPPQSDRRNRP